MFSKILYKIQIKMPTICALCRNDTTILRKNEKPALYNFLNSSIPNCIPCNFDLSKPRICGMHRKKLIDDIDNEYTKENIVDVARKKCFHEGCYTQPNFNFKGQTKGIYCKEHKLDGMVDVVSKKCAHEGCSKGPNFNYEGKKGGIYCSKHKLDDMVDVKNKTCFHEDCHTRPFYNFKGQTKGIYCKEHKLDGMVDVLSPMCSNCNLYSVTQSTNKYGGLCISCAAFKGLTKIPSNYGKKEKAVVEFIKQNFSNLSWTFNRPAFGACSRKKTDAHVQFGNNYILIIEVDEGQHNSYDTSCDNARTMSLMNDFGTMIPETGEILCLPMIFIRFNPDGYKNGSNSISSCWKQNKDKQGVLELVKPDEWKARLNILKDTIQNCINDYENKTKIEMKEINIIKLFFDKNETRNPFPYTERVAL
jgi:hypothetical protein